MQGVRFSYDMQTECKLRAHLRRRANTCIMCSRSHWGHVVCTFTSIEIHTQITWCYQMCRGLLILSIQLRSSCKFLLPPTGLILQLRLPMTPDTTSYSGRFDLNDIMVWFKSYVTSYSLVMNRLRPSIHCSVSVTHTEGCTAVWLCWGLLCL